jgi:hypothetical protein
MPSSRLADYGSAILLTLLASAPKLTAATVTMRTDVLGSTPGSLAYNSGHFVPGSNTRDWWHYSGVTGARVFITASLIEPPSQIPGGSAGVTNQAAFLARRTALRANPLATNYVNWSYVTNQYGLTLEHGSNLLNVNYACSGLRHLAIRILVCITASAGTFPITDANDWAGKWSLWQHFYVQAFYLGHEFDIERYQMYNEPNLDSLTQADYLQRLQLASDAVQSALADVNSLYGKALAPQFFAPVAAGTASSTYASWGRPVVTNRHTNFLGQADPNFWLIRHYDYHEYNSTPANFGANLASLNASLAADMSPEPRFPTAISEFNVHTASTFNTMTETLDSPSQYARFGALVANLANNACDELYCFKFSQTLYSSTVPIKKNGMLYVDNTNAPCNIGGITKAGEVWRLFAKAAPPGGNRLNLTKGSGTSGLDLLATYDPAAQMYHLFSANDSSEVDVTLDVSAWNLPAGQRVLLQEVSETSYGGVKTLATLANNQIVAGTHGSNTVWMFSLPNRPLTPVQTVLAAEDAMVADGTNRALNYGSNSFCQVRNNSTNSNQRSAAFVKFHLPAVNKADLQFALLTVRASSINGGSPVQAHVYGLANNNWSQSAIAWANAPNLAQNIPPGSNYTNNFLLGAGDSASMLGQLVADALPADHTVEVTDFVREAPGDDVSFLLAREVRFYGDVQDDDGMTIVPREGDFANGPRLQLVLAQPASNAVPPSISVQPANQTVTAGMIATLAVTALGTAPLAYQWYFNGSNAVAPGTNATLILSDVQTSQAGYYGVVITNAAGTVTSSNAQLVVLPVVPPALPAYDGFDYAADTALVGQGGWLLNGGTSGTVEAGSLAVPGLANASGNRLTWGGPSMSLRRPLGSNLASGAVYFSFILRVDTLGASFASDGTLAGFTTGTGTSFGTKVNIRVNGAGGFNLGVSKAIGTTYGGWAATDFNAGDAVFVVGRYRFNSSSGTDDLSDLWLNPDRASFGAGTAPPAAIAGVGNGGNDLTQIDRFFFRSGGTSSSPAKLVADELRIGLTWADVTPPAPPELTLSPLGNGFGLCWPTNCPVFFLQATPSLSPPAAWNAETGTPAISGTNYIFVIQPTNAARFFRLAQQK